MTCQELRENFELYALGVLEGEEKTGIDAHLAQGCRNCHKALADALSINAALLSFVPKQRPRGRLKRRLLSSIGVHYPGWEWVWALGATLLLAVALWVGVQERQRTTQLADIRRTLMQVSDERDRLTQALNFLADPQTQPVSFGKAQAAAPRGYLLMNPLLGVLLIASNLPAAGEGKAYEMWVTPQEGGAPRPAGVFQAQDGRALHILHGPVDMAMLGSVRVTLEPAAGSSAPTSKPLIAVVTGP